MGPPTPKAAPRACKNGHIYNPMRAKMEATRRVIERALEAEGLIGEGSTLFDNPNTPLKLTATYYMPRCLDEFINRDRHNDLKTSSRAAVTVVHVDTDNLTKYLMDIFTSVIYQDDDQVSAL